ncbi:MAG: DUF4173 domain-containing protein [Acutalibacteraceae bacterium]|nr:DUF4173 domain-containing protein [Acutalibacteraceae bacterium]
MSDNIYENTVETAQPYPMEENHFKKFDITSKDIIFAVIFTVASIIMSAFGIFGGLRIGFTVAIIMLAAVMSIYLKTKEIGIKAYPLCCFVLSIGIAFNFSVTSNYSVRLWSFALLILLLLVWFNSLVRKQSEKGDLGILKEIILPIFDEALPNLPITVVSLFSGDKKRNKILGRILLGVLPAIPLLFVIIPLLMSSDEAFSGMIKLAAQNTVLIILKIVLGTVISVFVISYAFSVKKKELSVSAKSDFKGIENTVIISFLSVLSVCYISYLVSQLAYFFSAFSGFLPEDYEFTVSVYARRGFFEMSVIAAINFSIIFAALLLSRKKDGKLNLLIRIICTFIGIFTLIIISTALSKMFLYIGSFGMTELRITTSAFMMFLAIVFIALMIRLFSERVQVIKTAFVTAALTLIALGLINVNAVIADYNYNAYKSGKLDKMDVNTIYELGDEGIPYLVKLTKDKNKEIADSAKLKISYSYEDYYKIKRVDEQGIYKYKINKRYKDIGQFSFSRQKAYEELEKYLKQNPEILNYKTEYFENRYF